MRFFLGTHRPQWLTRTSVPLFLSDRVLRRYKTLPIALGAWALDSGGFSELSSHGSWDRGPTPREYAARVRRYRDEIGHLVWAAPQDWMVEPSIVELSGLSVPEHQRRTVANFLELRGLAPDLPIAPVLQGWELADYLRCVDLYEAAGVDLLGEPVIGVGSVCRRQHTDAIAKVIDTVYGHGLSNLHGFGVKIGGLRRYARQLTSADSMAWSAAARREPPMPGCSGHKSCANCFRYAMTWRSRMLAVIDQSPPSRPEPPQSG